MGTTALLEIRHSEGLTDEEIVHRVRAGEASLYEVLVRRHNQLLYRVARAIVRNEAEAEDVVQDAYVRAFAHLDQFEGRARFGAWLTRIAVNEALARLRMQQRIQPLAEDGGEGEYAVPANCHFRNPEEHTSNEELGRILEEALLSLPEQYRAVVMLRDVQEMSTAETAEALGLTEENVKVRLHRGRAFLRESISDRVGTTAREAFSFMGTRCEQMTALVMRRVAASGNAGLEVARPSKGDVPRDIPGSRTRKNSLALDLRQFLRSLVGLFARRS
jgi:RNA polymerase sigma-70 factor (ECF subfamily)